MKKCRDLKIELCPSCSYDENRAFCNVISWERFLSTRDIKQTIITYMMLDTFDPTWMIAAINEYYKEHTSTFHTVMLLR